ncbi:unnamed protein product [Oppiella nova]|uniref:Uncharacterized protein n=1 Tax=Oppiella nova TaxID=334625 RepID=A0A7R9LDH9_9ACAR|nr:unnamed protein product [Oppiella nova]CAG2162551.1 unnamed protein product [Oppiella nova]
MERCLNRAEVGLHLSKSAAQLLDVNKISLKYRYETEDHTISPLIQIKYRSEYNILMALSNIRAFISCVNTSLLQSWS